MNMTFGRGRAFRAIIWNPITSYSTTSSKRKLAPKALYYAIGCTAALIPIYFYTRNDPHQQKTDTPLAYVPMNSNVGLDQIKHSQKYPGIYAWGSTLANFLPSNSNSDCKIIPIEGSSARSISFNGDVGGKFILNLFP